MWNVWELSADPTGDFCGQRDVFMAATASATSPVAFGYRLGKRNPTSSFSPREKEYSNYILIKKYLLLLPSG